MTTPSPAETVDDPEENADTQNGRTSQQWDDTADDAANYRYYLGPALCCTQPMPPPASVIISANFSYPPPPLPEYYIGPAIFDVMGPPPMACCVAESKFLYPPPLLQGSRKPYPPPSKPSADENSDNCPVIRWTDIVPAKIEECL
ncbi:uncharacterized protein LOC132947708 [Metopolophium dirhodum]|uniref:uncharacterized protein LOC132947708 n=1 Tax=Metopolophium dirhodum TaxID=44670 RepID=UPI0029902347|nr:uncharacterized protein LOC132947708 [Metopolophium dirhodum]